MFYKVDTFDIHYMYNHLVNVMDKSTISEATKREILATVSSVVEKWDRGLEEDRKRRAEREWTRFSPIASAILLALIERNLTAYQLEQNNKINNTIERYNTKYSNSTSLRGSLTRLLNKELIRGVDVLSEVTGHEYRCYSITEKGKRLLEQGIAKNIPLDEEDEDDTW